MIPGDSRETTEFGDNRFLDFLRQHERRKFQCRILVGAVRKHRHAREVAAKRQIGELDKAGRLRQYALRQGLQHLVGPDRRHRDNALCKQLDRLRIAGGVGTLFIK